jgi:hypothetical protein
VFAALTIMHRSEPTAKLAPAGAQTQLRLVLFVYITSWSRLDVDALVICIPSTFTAFRRHTSQPAFPADGQLL